MYIYAQAYGSKIKFSICGHVSRDILAIHVPQIVLLASAVLYYIRRTLKGTSKPQLRRV